MEQPEPYKRLIIVLSIVIPVAVAILFGIPPIEGYDFRFLPPIYASINAVTAVLLVVSFVAIKNQKRRLHEILNKTCIALSASFLIMYIIYHMTSPATKYG